MNLPHSFFAPHLPIQLSSAWPGLCPCYISESYSTTIQPSEIYWIPSGCSSPNNLTRNLRCNNSKDASYKSDENLQWKYVYLTCKRHGWEDQIRIQILAVQIHESTKPNNKTRRQTVRSKSEWVPNDRNFTCTSNSRQPIKHHKRKDMD